MKRRISHGQAMRSIFGRSRVTQRERAPGANPREESRAEIRGERAVSMFDPHGCDGSQRLDGTPSWEGGESAFPARSRTIALPRAMPQGEGRQIPRAAVSSTVPTVVAS